MELPDGIPQIPISDFFAAPGSHPSDAHPDSWTLMKSADVIFGRDPSTNNNFLVLGRDALKAIAKHSEPRHLKMIAIELDQSSEELEYLIALLITQRGQHDYEAN